MNCQLKIANAGDAEQQSLGARTALKEKVLLI
jgi:hypothetical protein